MSTQPHGNNAAYDQEIHELYRERNTKHFSTPVSNISRKSSYGQLILTVLVAVLVSATAAALVIGLTPTAVTSPIVEKQPRSAPPTVVTEDLITHAQAATVSIFGSRSSKSPSELERAYLAREALGQGFVLSSDGWVVTTQAVVKDAKGSYVVLASDGKLHQAEAVVVDPVAPLVYLKLASSQLTPTPFASFEELTVGSPLVATAYVGHTPAPALYQRNLAHRAARAVGARAELNASSESLPDRYLLDIDLPAGSQGAPIFTAQGKAVGLAIDFDGALRGVVPLDNLGVVIDGLFSGKQVLRPSLGLSYVQERWLAPFSAEVREPDGALVLGSSRRQAIVPKGPAAIAGVREGDRILSLAGERITERSVSALLQQYRPGARLLLDVVRDGKPLSLNVELGEVKSVSIER